MKCFLGSAQPYKSPKSPSCGRAAPTGGRTCERGCGHEGGTILPAEDCYRPRHVAHRFRCALHAHHVCGVRQSPLARWVPFDSLNETGRHARNACAAGVSRPAHRAAPQGVPGAQALRAGVLESSCEPRKACFAAVPPHRRPGGHAARDAPRLAATRPWL
jgi:hypothetical protein